MKPIKNLLMALLVSCAFAAYPTLAGDDDAPGSGRPERPEKPEKPEKPEDGIGRPGRVPLPQLGIPRNVELPADLKALVEQYQAAAKKFAEDQKSLIEQIRDASSADKAKLKEQIKTNRDKFLEDTKQLRADIREQVRDLRSKLKENGSAIDGGGEGKGKGRPGRR